VPWNWLRAWWRGRRFPRRVVLYTRAGCHLCDDAWDLLCRVQDRYRFVLEVVDVDDFPALAARYGACVPVVAVDGKVRFRGRVNPVLLRRVLGGGGGPVSGGC
jgi:hypothetical protein